MTCITDNHLSTISRLFSSSVVHELSRKGKSPLFARLASETALFSASKQSDVVGDLFEKAFSILSKKANRHEYVYKSALTQNVLLGRHSLNTASMLTEFRVGRCKADLAILNGTATAYEIKSERDSLTRLERQIEAYRNVFAKVYVIAGENHLDAIFESAPSDVGILKLTERYSISTLREALEKPQRTKSEVIFDSIQLYEAKKILALNGIQVPNVPNTELYEVLHDLFIRLSPEIAHECMVRVLKKTRNLLPLSNMIKELPQSLKSAALSIPLRKMDQTRLVEAVNTPVCQAMNW